MKGEQLSDEIKECIFSMYQQDGETFTAIVQSFSPEEGDFVSSLFNSARN